MSLRYESVLIAKILLNRIKRFQASNDDSDLLITYGDLSRKMDIGISPRNLDYPLGELSEFCTHECSLPKISALVVNQDSYLPGDGYFKYFYPGSSSDTWISLFLHDLNAIKDEKCWEALAESLHIELQ